MQIAPEQMPGVKVLTAKTFPDERGYLVQSWVAADLRAAGIPTTFKQAIQTVSHRGVVRGLHFQWDPPMGKYVRCLRGAIIDVVVDVRHGSPRLGDHVAVELSDRNHRVIWVPPGFAHGTFALEDDTIVLYECTQRARSRARGRDPVERSRARHRVARHPADRVREGHRGAHAARVARRPALASLHLRGLTARPARRMRSR